MHIFSIRHIADFLHLETLDSMSILYLGPFLDSEITNIVVLNRQQKGYLFMVGEQKTLPCLISTGMEHIG